MKARNLLAAAAVPVAAAAAALAAGGTAHATPTTVTAVTHISNRPDSGNGGTWSYDQLKRTLTVKLVTPSATATGLSTYSATVSDTGSFSTIGGAGTPNQFVVGAKILHNGVKGEVNGSISYTVTAPAGDQLTGTVPATESDNFSTTGAGFTSTSDWPKLAFNSSTGVTVTEGNTWSWKYSTACESWTDSAVNGNGNTANDGNITGKICEPPPAPYVYAGHVLTVNNNDATVGWSESVNGWPNPANKCEEVWISGYGFGAYNGSNPGNAHIGFTCDHSGTNANEGFLSGLAAGHTYALRIVPAVGTYGDNHPIPGARVAYVDVVTTR